MTLGLAAFAASCAQDSGDPAGSDDGCRFDCEGASAGGAGGTESTSTGSGGSGGSGPSCTAAAPAAFAQASPYALPAPRCDVSFEHLSLVNHPIDYALLNLTADPRPDLVVYSDDCDTEVGTARWDVYPAGLTGFAAAPSSFALPAPRCGVAFDHLSLVNYPVDYALLDLAADGRSDLVVHSDDCDAEVGTARWDVYPTGPEGFAPTPLSFALPAPRCDVAFDHLSLVNYPVDYDLLDLTGDGRPDLVVHSDDCDAEIGTARWDVYTAGPDGFAPTPLPFALPAPRCGVSFERLSLVNYPIDYALLDLTADRRPDLVVYSDDCDVQVGTKQWDYYPATATGFAPQPAAVALPTPRCETAFDDLASVNDAVHYALIDTTVDCRPDLVVYTDACDTDIGEARWDVYPLE
jgi:hypothetical protein